MQRSLDNVIDDAINPGDGLTPTIVGTVVLVSQCGKRVYQRAAGYADWESQIPVTLDTLFRLSSVTKLFTTLAAGVLLDQGKLKLEDKVTQWLPWFTPKLADGTAPDITIGHLLCHSAGLNYGFSESPDGPYHQAEISDGLDNSGLTLEENLKRIASVPLLYPPGTAIQYSVATDVLGGVIAEVHGTDLSQAIRSLVTEPLGISQTDFTVTDSDRLAEPYVNDFPRPRRMGEDELMVDEQSGMPGGIHYSPGRAFDSTAFQSGGAGMVGMAEDVERLLQVLRTDGYPLFSQATLNQLLTDRAGTQEMNPGWGFASSWQVLRNPMIADSPQSPGTISWGGVYGHNWFIDFEQSLSVVILTNTAPEGLFGEFVQDIRDRVYTALLAKAS
ncbi:serine hydrolase domain-containing protein [Pragia fontium]|uniref:CubicO group peptidase, beta-lactamase class C family n=1 Tax=Pragia fontium DSM 5563 = ATCC 49100 TaxID=1122977 RepID=A0AAJ4WD18_9GAMM|nr:serine hydrolase domain-containing protein [Pragia fontium]SFD31982.1 CubicO group peptidase, beta-lactamase class C family [Pragia fontium DSM 5563 = ATCC 49100]VEJ57153.1 Esterase estB [Pragia fontium]